MWLVFVNSFLMLLLEFPICSSIICDDIDISEGQVIKHLDRQLHGVQEFQRPIKNASQPVIVGMGMIIQRLINVDEQSEVITITGYFELSWKDEFRIWQHDFPYNCIDEIFIHHDSIQGIWLPDAVLVNADSPYGIFRMENEPVRIQSTGNSEFSPGGIIEAHCGFDFTLFPFDVQNCSFLVESWRLGKAKQIFTIFEGKGIELANVVGNEQWEVVSCGYHLEDAIYPIGPFSKVDFYLILKRKAGYYFINVIIPSTLISAAETATFLLPINSVTRLELSFTCLLSYSVFQIFVASEIPKSAINPPMLSVYIVVISCFIFLACCCQSLILIMADKSKNGTNFPSFISGGFLNRLQMRAHDRISNSLQEKPRNCLIWAYLTHIVNRIGLFFYVFVMVVTPFVCFAVVPRIIPPINNK